MRLEAFDRKPSQALDVSPVDVLNIFAILLLAMTVGLRQRWLGELAPGLFSALATLLLYTLLLARLSTRGRLWRVVHEFSSTLTVIAIFTVLGPIIECAHPVRWDVTFAQLDTALLGRLTDDWQALLGRPSWFVDLAYVFYLSYFFLPLGLGIVSYRRQPLEEFRSVIFTLMLMFYLCYVGYFLFPTLGPRVPLDAEAVGIGGGVVSAAARVFLHAAEHNPNDAFPSGHAGVALACLFLAPRVSIVLAIIFVPFVAGSVFATVFLHFHYVVDVLAGAALAGATVWLGPRLEPWCSPLGLTKRVAIHLGLR